MAEGKVQIYTLSDIDNWRRYDKIASRIAWDKYTSENFGFNNWIKINNSQLMGVGQVLLRRGVQASIGIGSTKFFMKGGPFSHNRELFISEMDGSLVILAQPETEVSHLITPESQYFTEDHLLEHINLAVFSDTVKGIRETVKHFGLEVKVKE